MHGQVPVGDHRGQCVRKFHVHGIDDVVGPFRGVGPNLRVFKAGRKHGCLGQIGNKVMAGSH